MPRAGTTGTEWGAGCQMWRGERQLLISMMVYTSSPSSSSPSASPSLHASSSHRLPVDKCRHGFPHRSVSQSRGGVLR
eukprot:2438785-Pyramimonas_sp.AAC.1